MNLFLEGERIGLRTIKKSDLEYLEVLFSDRETAALIGEIYPMTEKNLQDFYDKCQDEKDRIWFVIVDKKSGKIIGETGFLRIFMPWRRADFSLIIWDKDFHGEGYGEETARLMLDYGFNTLNLHRLAVGVVGINRAALKFWKKIGFVEEGREIEGFFLEGAYSDFVMLSLLESNYREIKFKCNSRQFKKHRSS